MGKQLGAAQITEFLTAVGERVGGPSRLVLLGGSALGLFGNSRPTLDVDYDGEEQAQDEFSVELSAVARLLDDLTPQLAAEYDMDPMQMRSHLALVESMLD